jgi:hypothetical protein
MIQGGQQRRHVFGVSHRQYQRAHARIASAMTVWSHLVFLQLACRMVNNVKSKFGGELAAEA